MGKYVSFKIIGKPIGKGRPKFSRRGNFIRTYTPEQTVNYENLVKLSWMQKMAESGEEGKLEGKIHAYIHAYFKIPASVSKKKRAQMLYSGYDHKPDADNIAKSILDALNGIAYDDDAQVVSLTVEKTYGDEECVIVNLEEIEYDD